MNRIYKYFSSDVFNLVFQRGGFSGVKCSYPKNYNDPYELFLGADLNVSPDNLAVYQDIVQELPQFPTTCFSKSPVVAPMWAHYASNHSGFVLEFDLDALKEIFYKAHLRDVNYKDAPDGTIAGALHRVSQTKKPRHAVWLRQCVLREAYFSKLTVWSYEQECRLLDFNNYVEENAGNMILFIPLYCLKSIIVGRNFPPTKLEDTLEISKSNNLRWFKSTIGKTQSAPFLVSETEEVFQFNGQSIDIANGICSTCSEPILANKEKCPWCRITDSDQMEAARSNPFRILDHYGLLEGYFKEVGKIGHRRK